jgi:hypothetical protein
MWFVPNVRKLEKRNANAESSKTHKKTDLLFMGRFFYDLQSYDEISMK